MSVCLSVSLAGSKRLIIIIVIIIAHLLINLSVGKSVDYPDTDSARP